jgi:hypothetical protein
MSAERRIGGKLRFEVIYSGHTEALKSQAEEGRGSALRPHSVHPLVFMIMMIEKVEVE